MSVRKKNITSSIDNLSNEINLLTMKILLEENRKDSNPDNLFKYSSTMFQLSKTLSELVMIEKLLNQETSHNNLLNDLVFGGKNNER